MVRDEDVPQLRILGSLLVVTSDLFMPPHNPLFFRLMSALCPIHSAENPLTFCYQTDQNAVVNKEVTHTTFLYCQQLHSVQNCHIK
jgi:hypothetical protein